MVEIIARKDGELTIAAFISIMVAFLFYALTPAQFWLDVRSLDAGVATRWQDVPIEIDRSIHFDFRGSYQCAVNRLVEGGFESNQFGAIVPGPYRADAVLPVGKNLDWWCGQSLKLDAVLEIGEYELCIDWTVNRDSWIWQRHTAECTRFRIIQM